MKVTHGLAVLIVGAAALCSTEASACTFVPPGWFGAPVAFETKGEVAQSADIVVVEYLLEEGARLQVSEPAGGPATTLTVVSRQWFRDAGTGYEPERVVYRPDTPLAPGTYSLDYIMPTNEYVEQAHATLTVLDELPSAGPSAPTLSWSVVAYDGPEDDPLFVEEGPCGQRNPADKTLYHHQIVADGAGQPPGYVTIEFEGAGGDVLSTAGGANPRVDAELELGDVFIQCVSATHTDIYGRASEPTRICQPTQCAARHRNDRGGASGELSEDCADWSPGYAERNAGGCACAQSPGAPAGSPAALALLVLGLLGVRRRR